MAQSSALRLVNTAATRTPTTLLTPAQSRVRQNFAAIAAAWKTLSWAEQADWLAFDKLRAAASSPRKLSAFGAFTAINGTLLASGMAMNTTPPTSTDLPPGLPASLTFEASHAGTGGAFILNLVSDEYPDHVQIYAAAPMLDGMDTRALSARYALITTIPSISSGSVDITEAYVAKYGSAPVGSMLALQLVPVSAAGVRGSALLLTGAVTQNVSLAPAPPRLTKTA